MAEAFVRRESDYPQFAKLNEHMVKEATKAITDFTTTEKPVANLLKAEKSGIPSVLAKMAEHYKYTTVRVGHNINNEFISNADVYSLLLSYKGGQDIITFVVDKKSTQLAYAKGSETEVVELLVQKGKTLAYEKFA